MSFDDVEVVYNDDRTRRVRVVYDERGFDYESPLDDGSGFEAVVPSRARFTMGVESTFQREFEEFNDRGMAGAFPRWLKIFHSIDAVMLYRYEHSAVAYSVSSFIGRAQHASWDSGPCGFMYYLPPDDLSREWWASKTPEERLELFEGLAESLTDWANGSIYGLVVEERATGHKTLLDSRGETVVDEDVEEWVETDEGFWGILGYDSAMEEANMLARSEA